MRLAVAAAALLAAARGVDFDEVAFFVLSTTSAATPCALDRLACAARPLAATFAHYNSRAVESMRTWARAFPLTWFVLPDNAISQAFVSRPQYGRRRRRRRRLCRG